MNYDELEKILTDVLYVSHLSQHCIVYYMCDMLDFFSIPHHLQSSIEHLFVKIDEKSLHPVLFGKPHGICDDPYSVDDDYQEWVKCGQRHRHGGLPAIKLVSSNVIRLEWWQRDKRHRDGDDEPTIWHYSARKQLTTMVWTNDVTIHRDNDLPALVQTDAKGDVVLQLWYRNGLQHRDNDKPAAISPHEQQWYKNDVLYRDNNQPAIVARNVRIWFSISSYSPIPIEYQFTWYDHECKDNCNCQKREFETLKVDRNLLSTRPLLN